MNKSRAILSAALAASNARNGAEPIAERPADIILPNNWTWERVEEERAKWGIGADMVPVASVPGACVAWGTINSVRLSKRD